MTEFRAGTVALLGRPNAGKSTLMNRILGTKLAITSPKPQTTRHRILGVHSTDTYQAVLLDTPGLHRAWNALNKALVRAARDAVEQADVICYLEDMGLIAKRFRQGKPLLDKATQAVADLVESSGRPAIFVANKMDRVPAEVALPAIEAVSEAMPLHAAVPISASTGDGVELLLEQIRTALPPGPPLFPPDHWTDATERFLVSEIVREKLFLHTRKEVPYATHVEVETFDESERDSRGLVRIFARIHVERPAQKGIVIGKGGQMLKKIGTLARKELEEVLGCKVHLELFVGVTEDWTRSDKGLRRVGFDTER